MTKFTKIALAAAFAFAFAFSANAYVMGTPSLKVGSTGSDVMAFQADLNAKTGTTLVVDGNYGPASKAAAMAFQAANGLTADGIFGPASAAKLNAMGAPVVPPTEDGDEDTDTDEDNGFDGTLSGEGEPTDIDVNDADDTDIDEGQEEAELGSIEFTAEDGDIMIDRVDVVFERSDASGEFDPWRVFDSVYLMVDGDVVAEEDTSDDDAWDETDTTNDVYKIRFSGVDFVAEEDEDIEFVVAADISDSIDLDASGDAWDITFRSDDVAVADGIRYEDASGFVDEFGSVTTAGFTIDEAGGDSELDVTESSDSPEATTLEAKDTATSTHTIAIFDVEADEDGGDIKLNDFDVSITLDEAGVATDFSDVLDDVYVVIDGEEYDTSTTITSAAIGTTATTVEFLFNDIEDDDIIIEAGDSMEVEVKVKLKSQNSGGYDEGTTIQAATTLDSADAEDADSGDSIGSVSGSATAELHTLRTEGLVVTMDSENFSSVTNDSGVVTQATYTVVLKAEAFGDTFYFGKTGQEADTATSTNAISFRVEDSANTDIAASLASGNISVTSSADLVNASTAYRINEGDEETITLAVTLPAAYGADGNYRIQAETMRAFTDAALTMAITNINFEPDQDYETDVHYLNF